MNWKETRKVEIEKLIEEICKKFSIKKEDLLSKSRKRTLVVARRYFMNIIFEVFESDVMTHADIAECINLDRTSFIHHRKQHQNNQTSYKKDKQEYDKFKKDYTAIISCHEIVKNLR